MGCVSQGESSWGGVPSCHLHTHPAATAGSQSWLLRACLVPGRGRRGSGPFLLVNWLAGNGGANAPLAAPALACLATALLPPQPLTCLHTCCRLPAQARRCPWPLLMADRSRPSDGPGKVRRESWRNPLGARWTGLGGSSSSLSLEAPPNFHTRGPPGQVL